MAERSRGTVLTIFAILFGPLALSNFSKPFLHGGQWASPCAQVRSRLRCRRGVDVM
jgi:hypothetical protein